MISWWTSRLLLTFVPRSWMGKLISLSISHVSCFCSPTSSTTTPSAATLQDVATSSHPSRIPPLPKNQEPLAPGTTSINNPLTNLRNSLIDPSTITCEDVVVSWYSDLFLHGCSATYTTGIENKIFQAFGVTSPARPLHNIQKYTCPCSMFTPEFYFTPSRPLLTKLNRDGFCRATQLAPRTEICNPNWLLRISFTVSWCLNPSGSKGPDGHLISWTGHFSVMRKWGKKDECQGLIICYLLLSSCRLPRCPCHLRHHSRLHSHPCCLVVAL